MLGAGAKPYSYYLNKINYSNPDHFIQSLKNRAVLLHASLFFKPWAEVKRTIAKGNPFHNEFVHKKSAAYLF